MRMVTPIEYAWVKDLLPKLHEADAIIDRVHSSSGNGDGNAVAATAMARAEADGHEEGLAHAKPSMQKDMSKRNTDESVSAARERYLMRKKQKMAS